MAEVRYVSKQELLEFDHISDDMNRGSKSYRLASHTTVRIATLALLAIPAEPQAQSVGCQPSIYQVCASRVELPDASLCSRLVAAPSFDTPVTSRAIGKEDSPADKATEGFLSDSSITYPDSCGTIICCTSGVFASARSPQSVGGLPERAAHSGELTDDPKSPSIVSVRNSAPPEFERDIYYKNKLEFSLDGGWLPINIPFVFDVFLGDAYTMTSLKYTLVPIIASLRWQVDDVGGPWIFRGNWDLEASGAVTLIPRGPETHYFAWIMGFRRNFVHRRARVAPYFDGRLGLGGIDAKGPVGVLYAQGQNFTFTMNMGSGVRYNFNPRYSITAGLNWMHISNLYLSEPKFSNYGINVYGPMFGIDVRLGNLRHRGSQ